MVKRYIDLLDLERIIPEEHLRPGANVWVAGKRWKETGICDECGRVSSIIETITCKTYIQQVYIWQNREIWWDVSYDAENMNPDLIYPTEEACQKAIDSGADDGSEFEAALSRGSTKDE